MYGYGTTGRYIYVFTVAPGSCRRRPRAEWAAFCILLTFALFGSLCRDDSAHDEHYSGKEQGTEHGCYVRDGTRRLSWYEIWGSSTQSQRRRSLCFFFRLVIDPRVACRRPSRRSLPRGKSRPTQKQDNGRRTNFLEAEQKKTAHSCREAPQRSSPPAYHTLRHL